MHKYRLWDYLLFPPTYLNKEKLKNSLTGKTVLITGASSGIGEELAYHLAEIELHMIIVARTKEKLVRVKNEIEQKAAKVSVFPADLRNQEEVEALAAFIQELPDGLDVFVSNAGISIRRSVYSSLDRYHDFTRTMALNYFAPVQLLLSLIPMLEKSGGQVINVSTVNTMLIPIPHFAAYQASKSAFDTWVRSAAPELNACGISTTSVYLPLVRTPMILPTPAYRRLPAMCPRHVARIICKAMYTKTPRYKPWWLIFGQLGSIFLQGIWERALPAMLRKRGNGSESD